MNISMWMIAKRLRQAHQLQVHILHGEPQMKAMRMYLGNDSVIEKRYAVLGTAGELLPEVPDLSPDTVVVINDSDYISIASGDKQEIFNELIEIFDYYWSWWNIDLVNAVEARDFQKAVNISSDVFQSPLILLDSAGALIACSYSRDYPLPPKWVKYIEKNSIPMDVLAGQLAKRETGKVPGLTFVPSEYTLFDQTQCIAAMFQRDSEPTGAFFVLEAQPFTPGDIQLAHIFCDITNSSIGDHGDCGPLTPNSQILKRLLSGEAIDAALLQKLSRQYPAPWLLLTMDNLFRSESLHLRNLIMTLEQTQIPCAAVYHQNSAVILVGQEDADRVVTFFALQGIDSNYSIGKSLVFLDISDVPIAYQQTEAAIFAANHTPGIHACADFALDYMWHVFRKTPVQSILHPALRILQQYDSANGTRLYETLFCYLLKERNLVESAKSLHIHRNTLLYRIQRITDLSRVDLEDTYIRMYLLQSFFVAESFDSQTSQNNWRTLLSL